MTEKETAQIMAVLKVAYPRYYQNLTQEEALQAVKLWHSMLLDYPYEVVQKSVKALIATTKFPPAVSEVIEKIQLLTKPLDLSEVEAWGMVKQALRNGYYHSKEEFEKLPIKIQQTLGRHDVLREWAMAEVDSVDTVIGSNFMRSYRTIQHRQKELDALPVDVKKFMEVATSKMKSIEQLEVKE